MPIVKCKICRADMNVKSGDTVVTCPSCGARQPVASMDAETMERVLQQGQKALKAGLWNRARQTYQEILDQDPTHAQANVGMLLAQEECKDLDAFVAHRLEVYSELMHRDQIWRPVDTPQGKGDSVKGEAYAAHIHDIVTRYTLPGYVEPEMIRSLYDYESRFTSLVRTCRLNYREEELYWENQLHLARAIKYAQGALAQDLAQARRKVFDALQEQTSEAVAWENETLEAERQHYEYFRAGQDKKAEEIYRAGLMKRYQHYQQWQNQVKDGAQLDTLTNAQAFFLSQRDYLDSAELAQQCQNMIHAIETARRRQKRKEQLKRFGILGGIAAVIILFITTIIIPAIDYSHAVDLLAERKFLEARAAFIALEDYRDSRQAQEYALAGFFLEAARTQKEDAWDFFIQQGYQRSEQAMELMHADSVDCTFLVHRLRQWEPADYNEASRMMQNAGLTTDHEVMLLAYQVYTAESAEDAASQTVMRYSHEEQIFLSYLAVAQEILREMEGYRSADALLQEGLVCRASIMLESGVVDYAKSQQAYSMLHTASQHPEAQACLDRLILVDGYTEEETDTGNQVHSLRYYDPQGRLMGERLRSCYDGYGACVYYTYDQEDRVIQVEWIADDAYPKKASADYILTTEYNEAGEKVLGNQTFGDGTIYILEYAYTYQDDTYIEKETVYRQDPYHASRRHLVDTYTRTYRSDGTILSEQRKNARTIADNHTYTYTYSNAGVLQELVKEYAWWNIYTHNYDYDADGVLAQETVTYNQAKDTPQRLFHRRGYILAPGS